ncbi:HNH/ENDO VII family nuclease [Bartonella sp. OC16QHHD]|uniref:two-partner secretion domain-containing protein n=1 Tax=Bartonella sp. OC16QHHD TaxID=3243562 RepID=UPI0035D0263B
MRGLKNQKHRLGYGYKLWQRVLCVLQRGIHKGLSLVLSFCLAFQPLLLQAQALGARSPVAQESQGIKAADGVGSVFRPTVGKAGNDVPLIDIVRPNGQGLSHNKYDSFNVDTHGVILNNSTEEVSRSQLGGLVPGNGNLRYSGAAKVILNEVVSANRSRLEGVSEVHGHMADVIIANPNGITCNGCGFINTPRVTLSTGQPIIGADGALSGLRVEGGDITIGSRGADGSALDIFDLVSRKISIGGPIQVKGDLAVIAGHNHFDYHKREATSLGSDGNEPELAIDSSEFGGMYAGQIRVIANDKGAGVKMRGDMVANAGAMRLTSDGKLVIAKARAKGAVKARSHHDSVHVKDLLFSEEAVELKALKHVELAEQARVAASGTVDVHADLIKLQSHALLASGIGSDGQQSATGSLHLQAAKLEAGNGRIAAGDLLEIQAATIDLSRMQDNDQTGVSSLGDLTIKTNQITALNNHIGAKGNIVLSADDALTVGAGHYSAGGSLLVEAAELTSRARLVAEQKVDLYAHHGALIQEGTVWSNGKITLDAHGALNHTGDIVSMQQVALTAGGMFTTSQESTILSYDVVLSADALTQAGTVEAQEGALTLQVRDGVINNGTMRGESVDAHIGAFTNQGTFIATDDLHLMVSTQEGADPQQAFLKNTSEGVLQSGGVFVVTAGQLDNAGALGSSGENVALNVAGNVSNSGLIYAKKSMDVFSDGNLTNTQGRIIAEEALSIGGLKETRAGHINNEAGLLSALAGEMKIVATSFVNKSAETTNSDQQNATHDEGAHVLARDGLRINVGSFENVDGLISTQGAVNIVADSVIQAGHIEIERGDLQLTSHGDLTNSGTIESNDTIALHAQNTLNQTGRIVSKKRIELSTDGILTLGKTSEVGAYDVTLKASTLTQTGLVEAQGGVLTLNSHDVLSNSGIMVGGVVDAKLGSLANSGQLLASNSFTLIAKSHDPSLGQVALVLNGEDGVLKSGGAFVLTADVLDNAGSIGSSGDGVALNVSADLSNSGLIYAKKSAIFSLDGDFINKFADVIAEDNLIIRGLSGERAGHVINSSGLLEAVSGDMTFDVSALTNMREGGVEVSDKVISHSYVRGEWKDVENIDHLRIKENIDTTIIRQQPHFTNNAAQILVGHHLTINAGDIRNSYSLIAANGNIEMHGDTLLNEGRDLIETTKIVTETRYRHKQCSITNPACINGAEEWDGPTFTQTLKRTYDAVYGTIEAGGTLDAKLTGYIDNHAVREGVEQVGLSSGDKGLAGVKNTDFDGSKPLISDDRLDGIINGLKGHKGLFAPSTKTPAPESIQVPTQDGLNSVKTELDQTQSPDVPFLVETRQDFINPSKFLGSDYYLKKIGNYKPENVFKRLGDAYFEYRLVGEQIFELTGNRTLLDVEDPNAQMQRLYDNAVEQQDPLGLELGKPLTPQQIAGIKNDMIWLETHLVDGQEVLVPHVYLAPNTSLAQDVYGAKTQQGNLASARLKGNGVTIETDRLTNSGTISSNGALHVSTTQTLFNDGGFLLGSGAVDLSSGDLLANSSGVILGDIITLNAKTIIDGTAKIRDTNEYGFVDRSGQQAQIISIQDLNIHSLGDLSMTGGQWSSGGPMTVIVDGSATFGSLVLESDHKETLEKGHYNAQSSEHRLTEVNSDGDLTIVTGGELNLGGKFKAKGNGDFTSGGALNAISEQDFNSFDLDLRGKEGDKSKQKNKFRQQSTEVTTNKTTIETEGNLSMHAQNGDLTLDAIGAKSGGQTHLASDTGKIKFLTNKDQDFKDVYQRNENLVWWSESDKGYLKETIEHVTIDAKGGIKLDAGDGFVVEYQATGDLDKSLEQLSRSPGLAWIKQLRDDPELSKQVDWQAVRAEFKDWDYKAQGLTEAGAALVALAVTAVTGGAASGAASAITGALGLGSSTAMNAAIQAGVQALINKSAPKTAPFVDRIASEAEKNLIKAAIGTGVQTALEGGSLDKNFFNNLRIALSDTVGKSLAEEIGTAKAEGKIDTVTQIVAHAGLGCLKGAVASGACTAGAVGGAVGEATAMLQFQLWVQGIVKEEMGDLNGRTPTAEEEARINAKIDAQFADFRDHTIDVARAAGGVAAALAGGDVDAGADAAGNAAENNYLSSAQIAQMNKELKECPDLLCEAEVSAKWSAISTGQGISFGAGIVAGVPAEIYDTVDGFWQLAKHPEETLKALKDFFSSGEILATIGQTLGQSYVDRINKMKEEYERAGAGGSFKAGLEFGKLLTETASLMTGVAGAAKGGIKLGEKAWIKFIARKDFAQFASKKNLAELAAQGDPDKLAARKELTKLAAKEKKLWLKKKPTKFTDSKFGQTYTVYRRDDLFDPNKRVKWTEKGETVWGTNIDRMKARRAPIGYDGKSVELHHLNQTPDGPLAEMSHEFHKKYTSVIHANPKTHQSLIDRKKFEKQREEYWYKLGNGYGEQENSSLGGIINMKWGIIGLNFDRWGQKHRQ